MATELHLYQYAVIVLCSVHYLFVDIDSGYPQEYQNTAGDSSRYFYASSYDDLVNIESSVLAVVGACPVPTTTTTTTTQKGVTTTVDASLQSADVCKNHHEKRKMFNPLFCQSLFLSESIFCVNMQ